MGGTRINKPCKNKLVGGFQKKEWVKIKLVKLNNWVGSRNK